ncbi:hypothetical protein VPH35_015925 [Triticum aestivum]
MKTMIHFYFCMSPSLSFLFNTLSARSRQSDYRPHGATRNGGRPRPATSRRAAATLPGRRRALVLHLAQIGRPRPVLDSDALGPVATPGEALPTRGARVTQRRPRP